MDWKKITKTKEKYKRKNFLQIYYVTDKRLQSKLKIKQQFCLVNTIQTGTRFEIFCADKNNPKWYGGEVKSSEWMKNELYFLVDLKDGKAKTLVRLHLQHHRLRKLKNLNDNPIDRSD